MKFLKRIFNLLLPTIFTLKNERAAAFVYAGWAKSSVTLYP